jgi:hypothetical protein
VKQAVWDIIIASNDYRGVGPVLMTDPNKEPLRAEPDELSM